MLAMADVIVMIMLRMALHQRQVNLRAPHEPLLMGHCTHLQPSKVFRHRTGWTIRACQLHDVLSFQEELPRPAPSNGAKPPARDDRYGALSRRSLGI